MNSNTLTKHLSTTKGLQRGLLLFSVLFFTVACAPENTEQESTYKVRPKTFQILIKEVGLVEAQRVVAIQAPFNGKLIFLPETGQFVKEGEQVMVMEDEEVVKDVEEGLENIKRVKEDLEANIDSLKIALSSNSLDVDSAQSELEFNRIRLEDVTLQLAETEVLLQRSIVPEDDLRSARSELSNSRLNTQGKDLDLRSSQTATQSEIERFMARIEESKLRGNSLLRDLELDQRKIEQAKINAPVAGLFQRSSRWEWSQNKMVESKPGDDLDRGQIVGEIPDLNTLIVRSQIPEIYYLEVKEGTTAKVRFDAFAGQEVDAVISKLGNVAIDRQTSAGGTLVPGEQISRDKVFEIELNLINPPENLKPGISASVEILLSENKNTLTVPLEALQRAESGYYVYTKNGLNHTKKTIVPGLENGTEVVIIEGLAAGETVFLEKPKS
ncbi:MAG: efflux RND transporter periplasmic adaptor subunit [Sumerlaeia bacterium]